jgi:hypothetical protein
MRRVALLAGVTACLAGWGAQAAVLEEFSAEDWSGFALADDGTGKLVSCAVYSNYQNGATLFFVRHVDGGWVLSLVHDSWALSENTSYPVGYRVDREPYAEGSGIALDRDQIGLALPDDDPLVAAVRRGTLLNVSFQGREFGFDLKNSGKALKAAVDCTERNRDRNFAAAPAQPQTALPPPASMPGPRPATDATPERPPATGDGPDLPTRSEAAPPAERQSFGPWVVSATRDASGHFLNCTAFGVHGTDQVILSYFPDDAWDLGLYRGGWALNPDQTYTLAYNVDLDIGGPGTVRRAVEAVEPTRVLLELEPDDELIGRLERGRELHVGLSGPKGHSENFRYRLDRTAEALAAARECTRQNAHGT